ncbi:MAG TPA: sodium/solute symporter [Gammaproteobacteria bacterium]|nr:sodium/solute symporter [Gammaproteobacteria bacterium]
MNLASIDIAILCIYASGLVVLAQWVSRERQGHAKDTQDYFLAGKALPWWAMPLLLPPISQPNRLSACRVPVMPSGSPSRPNEWMAAITLIIVGKFFVPIYLKHGIYTMPQFLRQRYDDKVCTLLAFFWLGVYIFVNLTSILWLGALAINSMTGLGLIPGLIFLGVFSVAYSLYGGLKAVALTDIVQVVLLVSGGLIIAWYTLDLISDGAGAVAGFQILTERMPEKFDMILSPDSKNYRNLPGISVLVGGMWIMNLSYWGFNQYIIQRALGAKNVREAQRGIVFAAFLKLLMPVLVVLPGMAAVILAPSLEKPDQAYPAMMNLLPPGLKGLVFAALIAAIVASLASKINSISTIFTMDIYKKAKPAAPQHHLVKVGRITGLLAILIAIIVTKPLLGKFDQAFQYIQEFTGFFTPAVVAIFVTGIFWKRATPNSAIASAIMSVGLSTVFWRCWPALPFMDRVGIVFLCCVAAMVAVTLLERKGRQPGAIELKDIDFSTSGGFNAGGLAVTLILVALYATWW